MDGSSGAGGLDEGGDIVGRADAGGRGAGRDALDEAGQDLAGPDFDEAVDAGPGHPGDRLAPAHRPAHLADQAADALDNGDDADDLLRRDGRGWRLP